MLELATSRKLKFQCVHCCLLSVSMLIIAGEWVKQGFREFCQPEVLNNLGDDVFLMILKAFNGSVLFWHCNSLAWVILTMGNAFFVGEFFCSV